MIRLIGEMVLLFLVGMLDYYRNNYVICASLEELI